MMKPHWLLLNLLIYGVASLAYGDQPPTIIVPSGSEPYNGSLYTPGTSTATEPIQLSAGSQLLIDDYLIKSSTGLTRRVNTPTRDPQMANPLVTGGAAGDMCIGPYSSVIRDPQTNQFRLYYNIYKDLPTGGYYGTLSSMESADGINWTRPHQTLGVDTFGASVIDEGPDFADPSKRYKLGWWGDLGDSGADYGMTIGYSADGVSWNKLTPSPFLSSTHDINSIYWDPARERYVALFTAGAWGPSGGPTWTGNRRVGLQTTSTDMINWEAPAYVLTPNDAVEPALTQFYGMSGLVFRGDLIIGMAKVLHDNWTASDVPAGAFGVGYTSLVWSRDGVHWTRDETPFFEGDPDPNAWDHAHAWGDFQLDMGDETYMYYGGYQYGHKYDPRNTRHIGMVKLERDRYVSRDADAQGGTMVTPVFVTDEDGVTVNASVDGELRIRVLDENGSPLPGFGWSDFSVIEGDSLTHAAQWSGDFAVLGGTPIQLEFSLVDGQLYGFTLVPEPSSLVLLVVGGLGTLVLVWWKRR